jgi:hypothetical protein
MLRHGNQAVARTLRERRAQAGLLDIPTSHGKVLDLAVELQDA